MRHGETQMGDGWLHELVETHALDGSWRRAVDAFRPRGLAPLRRTRPRAAGGLDTGEDRELPRVAVVIPCYNYGRYLPGAVASALDQEGVEVEVVIVDDASTDDSAAIATALADADGRTRLVRNATNSGHVVTFNNGLAASSGEFVVRLDADDLLAPGCLARAVALFRAEPSVGLVYGHPRHFVDDDVPAARARDVTWTVWRGLDWFGERCRVGVNCITTPEAMVRRSVIDDVGPLNTQLRFAQDMEMWCRVATVSDVGYVGGADQALHRDHAGSMSVTDGAPLLVDLEERATVFRVVGEAMGDRVPAVGPMVERAQAVLAREAVRTAQHLVDRRRADREVIDGLLEFARARGVAQADLDRVRGAARSTAAGRRRAAQAAAFARAASHRVTGEAAFLRWAVTGV